MKPEPATDRTALLRSALVETVDAAPIRRERLRPRFIVAAIAAFALAGACTGGAVSALALAGGSAGDIETVTISTQEVAASILGSHAQTFGTPFIVSGSGKLVVELGERPEGATSLLLTMSCVDFGQLDYWIDGVWYGGLECIDDGTGGPGGGGGGFTQVEGDGEHSITLDGTGRYVIWAVWAADQPEPEPSAAQQTEMADGVVTEEEYHAAFDRFARCMSDAGYPVIGVAQAGYLITYSTSNEAYEAGVDRQCYIAEFQDVDETWQVAHEDESESAQILRDCLTAHGLPAPGTMAEIIAALEAAGIGMDACAP